ncbi:MAG: hypothetical protein WKF30_11335, partial [Pyrinomonadaceae bacterium]
HKKGDFTHSKSGRAGLVCATASVVLGFGTWHLMGTGHTPPPAAPSTSVVEKQPDALKPPQLPPVIDATIVPPIDVDSGAEAREVAVEGGVVKLARARRPVRKVIIKPFLLSETEVTNAQYLEFIRPLTIRRPRIGRAPMFRAVQPKSRSQASLGATP